MAEAMHKKREVPVLVPDPLRPWRREIPQVLANIPPRVKVNTPEELDRAVHAVVTEHLIEIWRHAELVNSDLNLEVFGHLPEEILRELRAFVGMAGRA